MSFALASDVSTCHASALDSWRYLVTAYGSFFNSRIRGAMVSLPLHLPRPRIHLELDLPPVPIRVRNRPLAPGLFCSRAFFRRRFRNTAHYLTILEAQIHDAGRREVLREKGVGF